MREILILGFLLFTINAFSQNLVSDTISSDSVKRKPFVSRLFNEDPLKKHHHIIDLEFIALELSNGFLGYTYQYSVNQRISVGGRIGLKYFKSRNDISMSNATTGINYTLYGLSNVRIWKTVQAEFGVGVGSSIIKASKSNTHFQGIIYDPAELLLRTGVNINLWNHLFLKTGYLFSKSFHPSKYWFNVITWSIGYKF